MKLRLQQFRGVLALVFLAAILLPAESRQIYAAIPPPKYVSVGNGPVALAINEQTNRIYTLNQDDSSVTVIDGTSDTVVATIDVGEFPMDIALDRIRNRVYVANRGDNTVSVIDGATNTVVEAIEVSHEPAMLAFDAAKNLLYVGNGALFNYGVTLIDGETRTVIKSVPIPIQSGSPVIMAVNEATNKAYIALYDGSILIIGDGGETFTPSLTEWPNALAVNKTTNKIYVSTQENDEYSVKVIDGATDTLEETIPTADSLIGFAINEQTDTVYAPFYGSASLAVLDGRTNSMTSAPLGSGSNPFAAVFDPGTNRIFVAHYSNMLSIVEVESLEASSIVTSGIMQVAIAVNPTSHKLYSLQSDGTTNQVAVYNMDTVKPTVTITGYDGASSVSDTINRPFTAAFYFSEPVIGFTANDIELGNGSLSDFTQVGDLHYTALVTPTTSGQPVTIRIADGVVTDGAGNGNAASATFSVLYDLTKPTVAITGFSANQLFQSPLPAFSVTFSEAVYSVAKGTPVKEADASLLIRMEKDGLPFAEYTASYDEETLTYRISFERELEDGAYRVYIAGDVVRNRSHNTLDAVSSGFTVAIPALPYNVIFDKNGGDTDAIPATKTAGSGGNVGTLPTPPTRAGYTFAGWNTAASGFGGITFEATTAVTADITVYAQWTVNGGGSSGGVWSVPAPSCDAKVISVNGKITLPPCRAGEVSLGDAVTVIIPADATDKELIVTIEKVLEPQQLLTEGDTLASSVFEIVKSLPQNFKKNVTLNLAFDPSKLMENQIPVVSYYDETKKKWVEVAGGKVEGNRIAVEVNRFAKYAVFAGAKPGTAPAREPEKPAVSFSDIAGHWAEGSIKQAVSEGIVAGYPDETFRPNHSVTRAEFTVMLAGALKSDGTGAGLQFKDQNKLGAWTKRAVALAVQAGIVSGYKDGSFRPDAKITRAEMASMIARALKVPLEANGQTGFADNEDIPKWARGAVEATRKLDIVGGRGGNKFVPNDTATRSEAVVMLLRMLDRVSEHVWRV